MKLNYIITNEQSKRINKLEHIVANEGNKKTEKNETQDF
jgi:hypothetical protein